MAIATAGIIDQEWANTLREILTSDNYVDYYLETNNFEYKKMIGKIRVLIKHIIHLLHMRTKRHF